MLIDIESGAEIKKIPYRTTFNLLEKRLSQKQFADVVAEIKQRIEDAGDEIVTAGWLPGADWSGTPFQPIYETAALQNKEVAAKMFGLMVWYTIMHHPDRWGSGRFEKDGRPLSSRTYFRLK